MNVRIWRTFYLSFKKQKTVIWIVFENKIVFFTERNVLFAGKKLTTKAKFDYPALQLFIESNAG